jgi:hypothetical protein
MRLTTHLHLVPRSKNAWSYISPPQYAFMECCLVKRRNNLAFYLSPFTVHYNVHKIPPLAPILRQIYPAHTHPITRKSILILFPIYVYVFREVSFLQFFRPKFIFAFLISPMRATCPHHIFLDLITETIFDETYKLLGSSLCSLLQPPAIPLS